MMSSADIAKLLFYTYRAEQDASFDLGAAGDMGAAGWARPGTGAAGDRRGAAGDGAAGDRRDVRGAVQKDTGRRSGRGRDDHR